MTDYQAAKAWPFEQARKLLDRIGNKAPEKGYVLFETGYGPSGLPHLGTFCEVVRPLYVMQAFQRLSDIPTKLTMFSDDMDGFRKVPTNLPQQEMLRANLYKPLTEVPDPFGEDESLAHHNNRKLREFLDGYGFEYEFISSSEMYKAGKLNHGIKAVAENYDAIMDIVLPTLGEERRQTYSPFLPICPETRHVLQVPVLEVDAKNYTILYRREDGKEVSTSILDGNCKLQWKADFGMRWYALDVDYEMAGKDLIDSVHLSGKICRAMGKRPPMNMIYEHFVDENGEKISKSKGNGVSLQEWEDFTNREALSLFVYQKPTAHKKMYLGMMPKAVDDYLDLLAKFPEQSPADQIENPVWHIHNGDVPAPQPLSFNMLLNLVSTAPDTPTNDYVWGVVSRYMPNVGPTSHPQLNTLIDKAINYYLSQIAPTKQFRTPTEQEITMLVDLRSTIGKFSGEEPAEDIQTEIYSVGKRHFDKSELRNWFKLIYETLFGLENGPRMGGFIKIYGVENTQRLITEAISRASDSAA